ncbi:hypothetical protein FBY58_1835 [Zymomonas mobilis]|uniref:Uncharacterized protein n=1 Tax=Zymomonas mobilis TaxID=542 RepID=A0A542VUG6_ZYMMB|nr:hypothetical protein [Zymomonas mobilis]TQL14968.1 hypothetical protein FBY58_1835 [Zymomonas mobilis]
MDLSSTIFTESLNKASLLLQWIMEGIYDIEPIAIRNIIIAMSNIMDNNIENNSNSSKFNLFSDNFFKKNINKDFSNLFKDGKAICWLSFYFRNEFWAHGRGGGSKTSESEWRFKEEALDKIIPIMKQRYLLLSKEQIFQNIRGWIILEAWKNIDNAGFKKFWNANTKEDEGFIQMMEYLYGKGGYSRTPELYNLLKMPDLDGSQENPTFSETISRIESLKDDPHLGDRSRSLLEKIGTVSS